jgi:uncharacterized protein YyaL (SSP411 family)
MATRLACAISPYLLSHANNPVDWFPWSAEAFAAATARDVPLLVSIGYSTCHWCHVMARESFSDPATAAYLNEHFVSIKVDREENPEVDSFYMAAASAFTGNLGWPLTVFVTPAGKVFYAGTYFPPEPRGGMASFRQVLEAITDAWQNRREEAEANAAGVAEAVAAMGKRSPAHGADDSGLFAQNLEGRNGDSGDNADLDARLDAIADAIARSEDRTNGGFGQSPKFPQAPGLGFLLHRGGAFAPVAERALAAMAGSELRDRVEGGFFRYCVNGNWTEPHYERMLYDNALLLSDYAVAAVNPSTSKLTDASLPGASMPGDATLSGAREAALGIGDFLITTMRLPGGAFAAAQDSESTVAGERTEGSYYSLSPEQRAHETPPALDAKVLTGWNGLAIAALSRAGFALNPLWIDAARAAADYLLANHESDGHLVRASRDGLISAAPATLEDFGAFAVGLLELACFTGEVRYAISARQLIATTMVDDSFTAPRGDAVLSSQGLSLEIDPSEGAYPSGLTSSARASWMLYLLTADEKYRSATERALGRIVGLAEQHPLGFGSALHLASEVARPIRQLVVILPTIKDVAEDTEMPDVARTLASSITAVATESQAQAFAAAGFELFAGRGAIDDEPTVYLCTNFVCALPTTVSDTLREGILRTPPR